MFAYTQFLRDNIRLSRVTNVSPDTDVAVISLYESVTNLTFLHSYMQYGARLVPKTIRDIYTYKSISFRIRITNMLLASCNACNVRM